MEEQWFIEDSCHKMKVYDIFIFACVLRFSFLKFESVIQTL